MSDLDILGDATVNDYLLGVDVDNLSMGPDGSQVQFPVGKLLLPETTPTLNVANITDSDSIVLLDVSEVTFSSAGRFKTTPVTNVALVLPWYDVGYGTGWATYANGYYHPAYRKFGKFVHLRGNIKRSSGTGTTMFTLPVGFRPSLKVRLPVLTDTGIGTIQIATDGDVKYVAGGTGWIVLDGLSFNID